VELREEDLPEELRSRSPRIDESIVYADASDELEDDDDDDEDEDLDLDNDAVAAAERAAKVGRRGSIGGASGASSGDDERKPRRHSRARSESLAGGVGFSLEDEEDFSENGGSPSPKAPATATSARSSSTRAGRRSASHASHSGAESGTAGELSADMAKEAEGLGRVGRTLDALGHSQATYTEAMRSRMAEMGGLEHVDPLSDLESGIVSGSAANAFRLGGGAMLELGDGGTTVDELGLGSISANQAALLSARLEGVPSTAFVGAPSSASPRSKARALASSQRDGGRIARAVRRQKAVRAAMAEEDSDGRSLEPSPMLGPVGSPVSAPSQSPHSGPQSQKSSGILPPLRIEAASAGMARREEGEAGYRRASLSNDPLEGRVRKPGRIDADDEVSIGVDQAHFSSRCSVKSHVSGPPPMDEMAWLLSVPKGSAVSSPVDHGARHEAGTKRGRPDEVVTPGLSAREDLVSDVSPSKAHQMQKKARVA